MRPLQYSAVFAFLNSVLPNYCSIPILLCKSVHSALVMGRKAHSIAQIPSGDTWQSNSHFKLQKCPIKEPSSWAKPASSEAWVMARSMLDEVL